MELKILVCLAVFCLFLSIIRPLVRGLWKLEGLVACPLLAFFILLGIFPAYGFRPECVPLLLFALFLTFANIYDLIALFSGLQSDAYRDRRLIFTFVTAVIFACTTWVCFYYAPGMDIELSTQEVETFSIRDKDGELYVRIYGIAEADTAETDTARADASKVDTANVDTAETGTSELNEDEAEVKNRIRPLLILLPPVAGSHLVVEGVCQALRDKGFSVLTYSRPGFDSPAFDGQGVPVRLSIPRLFRLLYALTRGFNSTLANARSRELEEGRRRDTELLLRELAQNKTLQDKLGDGRSTIFLAGYGAGGAALTYLSGQDDFVNRYPQIKGIIAVEAPLFSSMESDPQLPRHSENAAATIFTRLAGFVRQFLPGKITHVENIPRPLLPALFLVSDRVIQDREGRYETIVRALAASQNNALLAAVPGAGPLDYSNSPRYYPILSFLFPGAVDTESQAGGPEKAGGPERTGGPEITASLITNFAALILSEPPVFFETSVLLETSVFSESSVFSDLSGHTNESSLVKTPLNGDIYLRTGGVWNIPNSRTILHP
ncbi:MAG: hypothetical protein LBB72_08030 [Spirochaetaceae bacterium]|jgi:hypothetical protein|nr:hypothetical protein [Spirochaetaceae bacterium]